MISHFITIITSLVWQFSSWVGQGQGHDAKKWGPRMTQANFIVCLCPQINAKFGAAFSHHGPMPGPNPGQPKRKPYISDFLLLHTLWGPFLLLCCFAEPLLLITLSPRTFYKSKRTNYNNKSLLSTSASGLALTASSPVLVAAASPQKLCIHLGNASSVSSAGVATSTMACKSCSSSTRNIGKIGTNGVTLHLCLLRQ